MEHVSRPVIAGIVAALVGFTSSFAVVLAGLRAVGATPAQAASGLLVLSLAQGLGILWLTLRHRTPLILAWSTPGAAMLATTGAVAGGWSAAVGAFLLVGVLILITGLWPALGRLVAAIPTALAQAMLAGVVLTLCLAPVHGLAAEPWAVAPILVGWLVATRFVPRWAVPIAFAITLLVDRGRGGWRPGRGAGGPVADLDDADADRAGGARSRHPPLPGDHGQPERAGRRRHLLVRLPGALARVHDGHRRRHPGRRDVRRSCGQPGRDHRLDDRQPGRAPRSGPALGGGARRGLDLPGPGGALGAADGLRQPGARGRDRHRGRSGPARHPGGRPVRSAVQHRGTRGGDHHVRGRGLRHRDRRDRSRVLGPAGRSGGPGGAVPAGSCGFLTDTERKSH